VSLALDVRAGWGRTGAENDGRAGTYKKASERTLPAIRLVKGAYDEPASIAFRRKVDVDAAFQSLCVLMLPSAGKGDLRLGMGTHDTKLIERVTTHAEGMALSKEAFEVEMLYGIRQKEQLRLAAEGYRVLALIAYGEAWYAWYMRRLAERPANVLFALRQIFG